MNWYPKTLKEAAVPTDILNIDMIDDNHCFGCGHANPHGLHIEIRRDPEDGERLIGKFDTNEHTAGFPGVTHGGALYTAFDCLSTWVATIFRKEEKALWILRSAETIYHMPAIPGESVHLSGRIIEDNGPWKPARIHTKGRNAACNCLETLRHPRSDILAATTIVEGALCA